MIMNRSKTFAWLWLALLASGASVIAQSSGPLQINSLAQTSKGWQLQWQQTSGTDYTVLFQDSPQDGIWRIPGFWAPVATATNQWTDPAASNAARFYRVVGVPAAQRGKLLSSTWASTMGTFPLKPRGVACCR